MSQITFTDDDVKTLRAFGKLLTEKARMELTIPEALMLNRYLSAYNVVVQKVEAHVLEVKRVVPLSAPDGGEEAPAPQAAKPSRKKG